MSAYKHAIDITLKAIEKRAKNYRNLITLVVIVGLCSIGSAIVTWTLLPLAGLLLIFPVSGFFLFLDSVQLNQWRSQLFIPWVKKELDFWAFCDAMRVNPHLPKSTLQGMIGTLPSSRDWAMEQAASGKTREAVVWVVNVINTNRISAALVKTAATGLVTVSILFAVILGSWYPIMLITLIVPLQLLLMLRKRWQLRKLRGLMDMARQDQEFNDEVFVDLIEHIDWKGVSLSEKKSVIEGISLCN